MNDLQIFNYNGKEIRTVEKNGDLWWVLKDVCDVLGLSNPTMIAGRLDEDEKDIFKTKSDLALDIPNRGVSIINESGLYNVILRSDKPEAKKFKRWVTHEVLPSIRKHGAYMNEQILEQALTSPDFLIRLAQELKSEKEARQRLEKQAAEDAPRYSGVVVAGVEENGGNCRNFNIDWRFSEISKAERHQHRAKSAFRVDARTWLSCEKRRIPQHANTKSYGNGII